MDDYTHAEEHNSSSFEGVAEDDFGNSLDLFAQDVSWAVSGPLADEEEG